MKKSNYALVLLLTCFFCPLFLFSQTIKEGYFNRTKLGVLPGLTNEEGSAFKQRGTEISNINGWYLNPKLAIGLGLGIAAYVNPTITTIPVYGSINYALANKRSTPYFYGNLGYSFTTTRYTNGGLLSEIGTGWQFGLGRKSQFGPEIGYRYQKYNYEFIDGSDGNIGGHLNSLSIGIVFTF